MWYQVRLITRPFKCMVTMWWVMAWLENVFGCSMKDERTCTMRRKVGVHLWWMMIWCVRWQTFHNFWSVPALSSDFKDSTLWHCQQSFGLSESVCMMGAQDAHRGAQKTACCLCLHISDVLSQWRGQHVEPYWQEMRHGFPISHLNQNSSPCTGSLLALRKGKSSSRWFQQGRSCEPYSGTDKVSSW